VPQPEQRTVQAIAAGEHPARPKHPQLQAPADPRTLHQHAAEAHTGPRTLARLFLTETGMTFGQWRTQIRLAASLPLLAARMPVARIAERVGYTTASAYVAAFRRAVGVSPGRYFAR
jgi:AraC-like DNA-binding protein